ncbi:MAG TPA: tRNA (N6-isopentenyl adenosine(37)-C2)-methylthiotransferase MiaB [Sumerlaeia bacterium]|nr:tRNA (N6-isopentenyl adenosine(37)-C2)-methylthiotransferase MiaB [Sumerlaeia bacterium]
MALETYKIVTFGCQMNAYDSEVMAGILEARGMRPVADEAAAQLLMLNTCIVRASAERRAVGRIAALRPLKAAHPDRILAVCGCMAQRDAAALLEKAPHIDLVLGTRSIPCLSALIDRILGGEGPIACVEACEDPYGTEAAPVRRSALRGLVAIMHGCDNWCSYCIVPAVRGGEKSRPAAVVIQEIETLVAGGCREVTLVGQNVNSYSDGETDFAALLERVNRIDGLARIRYITSHPRDAGQRHLDAVERLEKVCDHFHLPVQSGSNRVLERMNRGYTREHYLHIVGEIRRRLPRATVTTDLIVGFPAESQDDYALTLDLVEEVRFDAAFTFLYNVREGTRAAGWPDDVPLEEKKRRLARAIETQERISLEKNQAIIGRTVELLVEGPARRSGADGGTGAMMGRTTGNKCVVFEGQPQDAGRLVRVRITGAASHTLFGERIGAY